MKSFALGLLLVGSLASPALAGNIQIGYSGSSYGPFQSGTGGEFTYNDVNPTDWLDKSGYVAGTTSNFGPSGITSFQTFCIEVTELLNGYSTTYNAQINPAGAVSGGLSGGNPDPISQGTGWLYSQFAQGILSGYSFASSTPTEIAARKASALLLQNTIWWLEGETHSGGDTNIFGQAVIAMFGTAANQGSGAAYGVYALNMWTGTAPAPNDTNKAQDGLFYSVPDGGATLMLLGSALIGLAALRRRINL